MNLLKSELLNLIDIFNDFFLILLFEIQLWKVKIFNKIIFL